MHPEFNSDGTYTPDRLIYNTDGLRTGEETLSGGQGTLTRGTVLARDSDDSNNLVPVDSSSATTSIQTAVAILAEDTDTSDGTVQAPVYYAGEFNESELTFGGSDTISTHRWDMRARGLHTRQSVAA